MPRGFASGRELQMIHNDFVRLLNSSEGYNVTIEYAIPNGFAAVDEVYDFVTPNSVALSNVSQKALQWIVKPTQDSILRWGIMEAGDAVFFFDVESGDEVKLDRGGGNMALRYVIIDALGQRWSPAIKSNAGFVTFLRQLIGNDPMVQPVPCTLAKI